MPAKGIFIMLVLLLTPLAAQAINVGTVTTLIPAEKKLIAKEIKMSPRWRASSLCALTALIHP